jgi:hypothetical protein
MARKKAATDVSDRLQYLLMMMHLQKCHLSPAEAIRIIKRIQPRLNRKTTP